MVLFFIQFLFVGALALLRASGEDSSQPAGAVSEISPHREVGETNLIPLIRLERVPLADAIRNLAREEKINYVVDPRLSGFIPAEPSVTVCWTNVTATEALEDVLELHHLKLCRNPVTGVARIVDAGREVSPAVANPVGNGTNWVIPLMVIDNVSLPQAIRYVAKVTGMTVSFDKRLRIPTDRPNGRPIVECYVSIRWEDITAQQALGALLDIYDLQLTESKDGSKAVVVARGDASSLSGKLETTRL